MVNANTKSMAEKVASDLIWRLEILQHRCRYNVSTGQYVQLPTRVRRFSNACPTDIVAEVIDALVRMAPYTKLVFNGETNPELKYRPTTTSIRKDDSLKATEGSKGTYTIIQDLLLDGEPDTYSLQELSSCSQKVTAVHYWDETDIVDCPAGGQGFTYQIADVTRDKDTDLFSYKVRRTDAITQHVPEKTVECTDDETKTVELWDNVYTDASGNYVYDSVVHEGGAITIPAPCSEPTGSLVQIDKEENPDCTLKIKVTRVTSKLDSAAEYLRYKDQFSIRASTLEKNTAANASDVNGVEYDPVAGTKTTVEVKNNPDGTVNRRTTVETERAVSDAEKGETIAPTHEEVTWTDKNQTTPATGIPSGYVYGAWKCVKTPTGRYDNTFTGHRPIARAIGYQCNDTAFLHTHTSNETVLAYPSPAECVPAAAGGVVKTYDFQRDDKGIIHKTVRTQTEHPFSTFRKTVSRTLLGKTVRVYSKSQDSIETEPVEGEIGTTEFQITDGLLYDTVKETFVLNAGAIALGADCSKTVFEHSDAGESTVPSMGGHVTDAGGGVYRTVKYTKDVNTGAIRRQESTVTELPFSQSTVSVRCTPRYTYRQTVNRNQASLPASGTPASVSPGQSEQRETNPGGSVTQTVTEVTPNADAVVAAKCDVTALKHDHETETVLPAAAAVSAGSTLKAGKGEVQKEEVTVDENNVKVKKSSVSQELDRKFGARVHEDAMQAHQIIEETSAEENGSDLTGEGAGFETENEGKGAVVGSPGSIADSVPTPFNVTKSHSALSSTMSGHLAEYFSGAKLVTGGKFQRGTQFVSDSEVTPGGNFHTRAYKYVPKPQKWLDRTIGDYVGGHYTWGFRNLTQEQVKDVMQDACTASSTTYAGFANHPFLRRTMNDFGLYDGTCGFEAREKWWTVSGTKRIEEVPATILATWTEKSVTFKPVSQLDPLAGDYAPNGYSTFYKHTVTTKYQLVTGVGKGSLATYCATPFWASPEISINPSTEVYTVRACINQTSKIEIVAGGRLPTTAGTGGTLVDEGAA